MREVKATTYEAKEGDIVFFWNRSHPSVEGKKWKALVEGVGEGMYLDLIVFNNAAGGGRAMSYPTGCVPGDMDATREQLADCGTWMPRDEFFEWESDVLAEKAEAVEGKAAKGKKAEKVDPPKKELQPV